MKTFILGVAAFLCVAGAAMDAQQRPLKLVMARQSTAPPVDVMKDFSERCPNVSFTTNERRSDYMLYAGGWSGEYRFMVIGKGGDTLYVTKTVLLSNAVKDVCRFLNTRP